MVRLGLVLAWAGVGTCPAIASPQRGEAGDRPGPTALRGPDTPPPPPSPAPAPAVRTETDLRETFESRGFSLVGHYFLLQDVESEALARLKKIHLIIDRIERLHRLWAENEQIKEYVNRLDDQIIEADREIEQLQQTINGPLPGLPTQQQAYRAKLNQRIRELRSAVTDLRAEILVARKSIGTPKQVQDVEAEFKEASDAFRDTFEELRPSCDRVVLAYDALKKDAQVKDALKALKDLKKAQIQIGPSIEFKAGVARVSKTSKLLPPEPTARANRRRYGR